MMKTKRATTTPGGCPAGVLLWAWDFQLKNSTGMRSVPAGLSIPSRAKKGDYFSNQDPPLFLRETCCWCLLIASQQQGRKLPEYRPLALWHLTPERGGGELPPSHPAFPRGAPRPPPHLPVPMGAVLGREPPCTIGCCRGAAAISPPGTRPTASWLVVLPDLLVGAR